MRGSLSCRTWPFRSTSVHGRRWWLCRSRWPSAREHLGHVCFADCEVWPHVASNPWWADRNKDMLKFWHNIIWTVNKDYTYKFKYCNLNAQLNCLWRMNKSFNIYLQPWQQVKWDVVRLGITQHQKKTVYVTKNQKRK